MNKLTSRKFLTGVVSILVIGLNNRLGLGLDDAGVAAIVTIATTGIGTQTAIDALERWFSRPVANPNPSQESPHA